MLKYTDKETSNLSVMTVVLPQSTNACENCECLFGTRRMTKNNLSHRCPFLKGYPEPRRYLVEPHQMSHREWESLREAACFWKDKYDRLYESQRRLQKVNQGLEEKLLKIAEKFELEKSDLTRDVSDLTSRLVEARLTIAELEEENEQYRNDCNIAVRLLQCKPSNFVAHKFTSLPVDFQEKVKKHLTRQQSCREATSPQATDVRTIKVSVPTLPPAAMVYSVNHHQSAKSSKVINPSSSESTPDHVSAAIIAKVLEERGKERTARKQSAAEHCDVRDSATQTSDFFTERRCRCHCRHARNRSDSSSSTDSGNPLSKHGSSSSTETAI